MPRRLALALTAAALALAAAPAAHAQVAAGSKTVSNGNVSATLTWQQGDAFAENPTLKVTRDGAPALDTSLGDACEACTALADPDSALHVRDLDGNGDPEVFVDAYTGGAHCCTVTVVYGWAGEYRPVTYTFGNADYVLQDLDKDGRPEFITGDDSFAYVFTAYAFSAFPVKVLEYGTDRSGVTALRDVTVGYPALIRRDARHLLRQLRRQRRDGDPRGVVAAYVADQYHLYHRKAARRFLLRELRRGDLKASPPGDTLWPSGRGYIRKLTRFLHRLHYDV